MARPQMDADPTARTRAPHEPPVTTATCVNEALAHLRATGETAAVVYRSGSPVGIVTATALTRAIAASRAGTPITTVLDYVAVPVDRQADPHTTLRAFTDAGWNWLRQRHS